MNSHVARSRSRGPTPRSLAAPAAWVLLLIATPAVMASRPPEDPAASPPPAREAAPERPARARAEAGEPRRREAMRRILSIALERFRTQARIMRESLDMLDRGEPLEKVRDHADSARGGPPLGPPGPGGGPDDGLDAPDRPPLGPGGRTPRGERRFGPPPPDGPGGPGGEDMGGPPPGGPPEPLSPEQRAEALELLRERGPELFARMQRLRQDRPGEFDDMLRQRMPTLMRWLKEKAEDPELYGMRTELMRLERESHALARRIRNEAGAEGGEGASEAAKKALRDLVGRTFDLRMQVGQREIDRLAARLEKMRDDIIKRRGGRESMIDDRVRELLNPPPDEPAPPPRGEAPARPGALGAIRR